MTQPALLTACEQFRARLAPALLSPAAPERLPTEVRPVSSSKRMALFAAAATVFILASPARGRAQIWFPYPYPPAYRYAGVEGALRLEVTPREAEVYVDGYYAGIVDDFDGMFQRLRVAPGQHDITLYRDGYRSATQKIYVMPDATFKIKYRMELLPPGEIAEPRPIPAAPPGAAQAGPPLPPRGPKGRRPMPPPPPAAPRPEEGNPPPREPSPDQRAVGTLAIRVQPADAEIVIDGQPWRLPEGQERLLVDASEGRHMVQIRKPGYVGYLTDAQVRRGETTTINVNLRTQP